MKEESVFWLGGTPGTKKAAESPPAAGQIEPVILAACRARGLAPEDFVVALGAYGSWLVHFSRNQRRERIVWDGRAGKLVLQAAIRSGGWQDLRECPVAQADQDGFVAAIGTLVSDDPARPD